MEDSASEYEDPTYEELKLRQDYWRTDELTSSVEAGLIARLRCQDQDRYVYAVDCDPPKKAVNFICIHCGHAWSGFNCIPKHKKDCKVHPNKMAKKTNPYSQRKNKRPIVDKTIIPARRSKTQDIGMPINDLHTDSDSLPSESDSLPSESDSLPSESDSLPSVPESPMPRSKKSKKSKRTLTKTPMPPTRKSKRNRKQTK